jgi:hypothetical protein
MRIQYWLPLVLTLAVPACSGDVGPGGPPGEKGTNGANGAPGTDGADGKSCTISSGTFGVKTIQCEDGTSVTVTDGMDGADGNSCSVLDNHDGTKTIYCEDGTSVTVSDGRSGEDGLGVEISSFHGSDTLLAKAFGANGKFFAKAEITSAMADINGVVSVSFTLKNQEDEPIRGIRSVYANIAKLVPPVNGDGWSRWVPYIYRTETVSGSANGDWPRPDGTIEYQGSRENTGTLMDHGDGSYTYVFSTNLSNAFKGTEAIAYERNRTHRVSIMIGGRAGPTATATKDFVPDGATVTEKREIVETETCKSCHGTEMFGHGGDRLTVENCVTCHVAGTNDAQGGESLDFKVMIHKIHAGGELKSLSGADGILWNDPATPLDESLDNGEYAIWGYQNHKTEWWKVGFPAIIENCTKCHQGSAAQANNWKTNPSRTACGSCHADVNFATGANHTGGIQRNDQTCSTCHPSEGEIGDPIPFPIPAVHDWTVKDPRNIPEFAVEMSVSSPANGTHFVAGERPVVSVALRENGVLLDHNTIVEDTAAEGCASDPCPARDGAFRASLLFVHGPRAKRNPVLTSVARARIVATSTGPFNLSAANAALSVVVDGGKGLMVYDSTGGDSMIPGTLTIPVSSGTFADRARATSSEIIAWLNADRNFKRRAIAYLDEAANKLAIRSRNLGNVYSVQLKDGPVTSAVFGGDLTVHTMGVSTAGNTLAKRANAMLNDPKVTWTSTAIRYTLDPVDDLAPGTYVAAVEISDRGRVSATDYKTPSVARVTFQVKTATEEKAPAGNCGSCHMGPEGKGFVLDFSRHNKIFNDTAVDQCGSCHDYQPMNATGTWSGARPIAKRVHAVHFGSSLNYPLSTVDYSNGDPIRGRNWDITFPQDVRNCQTCHPANSTSGSWTRKPARLPCSGCHDSDAANAHMTLMTYDPTPADPFSGDEQESCGTCHAER